MNRVAIEDLQGDRDDVRQRISAGEALVVTLHGEALGVLMCSDEEALPAQLRALRLAALSRTVRAIGRHAQASGANLMTEEDIRAEIDAARYERRLAAATSQPAAGRGCADDQGGG